MPMTTQIIISLVLIQASLKSASQTPFTPATFYNNETDVTLLLLEEVVHNLQISKALKK